MPLDSLLRVQWMHARVTRDHGHAGSETGNRGLILRVNQLLGTYPSLGETV